MKYRIAGAAMLLLFAPLTAALAQTSQVSMIDDAYTPQTITVPVGTTVTWKNNGMHAHTVTSSNALFDSGTVVPGGTYSRQFTTPGTYYYYCKFHPNMWGTVIVTGQQPHPQPPPQPPPYQYPNCGSYYSYMCYPQYYDYYYYQQPYYYDYSYSYPSYSYYPYQYYSYDYYEPYYYSYDSYYDEPYYSYDYYPYDYGYDSYAYDYDPWGYDYGYDYYGGDYYGGYYDDYAW